MKKNIQIKDFYSLDIENIWDWKPSDSKMVYFRLDVYIGEIDQDTSTIFSLIVTSPEAIVAKVNAQQKIWGKGYLIIEEYSFVKVENAINELIEVCSRKSKNSIDFFKSLSKILFWEYDN